MSRLRQRPPPEHIVDAGDVLGIFIEGILGAEGQDLPINATDRVDLQPSVGYPITVRLDGSISVPYAAPISVRGLTLPQVEQAIRRTFTVETPLLKEGADRIIVSLLRPRCYRVLVIRQEAGNDIGNRGPVGAVNFELDKRGTGRVVYLNAYENDVLHALTRTGGLPGLDAQNAIYIIRHRKDGDETVDTESSEAGTDGEPANVELTEYVLGPPFVRPAHVGAQIRSTAEPLGADVTANDSAVDLPEQIEWQDGVKPANFDVRGNTINSADVVRIPLRVHRSDVLDFDERDIVLQDGDVVFIEARETEYFFSGGLLGGGQYILPRDYDLDLIGALSIIDGEGRANRPSQGIGGPSVMSQDVTIGASQVIIHRMRADGCRQAILVDLRDALDRSDCPVLIQPQDHIFLRYTCAEAVFAYFERMLLPHTTSGVASALAFGRRR